LPQTFDLKMKKALIAGGIIALLGLGGFAVWKYLPAENEAIGLRYIPVKEEDEERWSVLDLETGQIVVDKEWKNEPQSVTAELVAVENSEGNTEFYTLDKKPKQVGGEYRNAGFFSEGLAPVAEPDKPVAYINTEGKEVFELKEADGKSVDAAGHFREGMARFRTTDGKWGYINRSGKVVIKAKFEEAQDFREGYALVTIKEEKGKPGEEGYEVEFKNGFIDMNGDYAIKPKSKISYQNMGEGLIAFQEKPEKEGDEKKTMYGFMDINGEKVIKPRKDFKQVLPFIQGYASFNDGEAWGIMDKKGEIVVRAKYEEAICYNKQILVEEDKGKWGIVDLEGKDIIPADYKELYPFLYKHTLARDGDYFIVIDGKNKEVSKSDYKVGGAYGQFLSYWLNASFPIVSSDFVDAPAVIEQALQSLAMDKPDQLAGKNLDEVIRQLQLKEEDVSSFGSTLSASRYELNDMLLSISANFDDNLQQPQYTTEYYYGYPIERLNGYALNRNAVVVSYGIDIKLYGKLARKSDKLAEALESRLKKSGYMRSDGQSTAKMWIYNDGKAVIRFTDDRLELLIANEGSYQGLQELDAENTESEMPAESLEEETF